MTTVKQSVIGVLKRRREFKEYSIPIRGSLISMGLFFILNIIIWHEWAKMFESVIGAGKTMGDDIVNITFWNVFAFLIVAGSVFISIAIGFLISATLGYVVGWFISFLYKGKSPIQLQ